MDHAVASADGYAHILQDAKCQIQYTDEGGEINLSVSPWSDGLVLLMHLNNDSSYGENDTHVYDFSGNGNNGTVTNASVDFPDPDGPVITTSLSLGISTSIFLRLWVFAPLTLIYFTIVPF